MRNVYILLVLTIVLIIALLVFAFLFFEKEKHQTYFYSMESAGEKTASIKIDRYKTEDKIIYKSTTFYRGAQRKITHEKLVFDRRTFKLERFFGECKNSGVTTAAVYIDTREGGRFDFLSRDLSKSSFASSASHAKDTSVFHEESIVTYMPLIDKYNFIRGGAQSFKCIYRALSLLPPARARIIFTSVRDEYIKVCQRKTKTEFLVVKSKALPESRVWVSKKKRSIARLEIKSKSLLIEKVRGFPKITPPLPCGKNKYYTSQEITFPSEGVSLAGTLEIPRGDGKLACVLLVGESDERSRKSAPFYADISRHLAENGNIVLRFDPRGTGRSQGANAEVSLDETTKDIENALKFLLRDERIDKDRAFIVAHGSACSYLSKLDLSENPLRGIVMMGTARATPIVDFKCAHIRDEIQMLARLDKKYPEILESSVKETLKGVGSTEKDYEFVLGKRIFLKRMRQLLRLNALAGFRSIKTPLLIIYGKKDKFCPFSYIRDIEKNLKQAGMRQFSTVSFRGLGHFFEKAPGGGNSRKVFKVDPEVLKKITRWIKKKCTLPADNS